MAARNLARTHIGRAFVAVRDRDISAEILGVNLLRTKLLAFAIGAFYAGVAGGLLGYFYGAITPEYFVLTLSVFYLAAVIVGGLGSVLGSILGALFMTFVPEVLRLAAHASSQWFPGVAGLLLPMGQVVFGLLIIGFLVFEPHGLAAIWSRIRRTFHLWPSGPEYSVRRHTTSIPKETTMTNLVRRKLVQSIGAAASLGPFAIGSSYGQAHKGDIVIGASQPITGIFSFAGVAMNNGLNDFVQWKNAQGRSDGPQAALRRPRTAASSSTRAWRSSRRSWPSDKPSFFYGDSTQWVKAIAQDAIASNSVMTSSPSLAAAVADPASMPQHFVPGPDLSAAARDPDGVHRAHVARRGDQAERSPTSTPTPSSVATAFPAARRAREKLGLPIVAEIVTKQAGIDVAPEVAQAAPREARHRDLPGLHRSRRCPSSCARCARPGSNPQIMGTAWGLDKPAYDALGALGARLTGVSMYRYGHETDAPMINDDARVPRQGAARREAHLDVLHLELAVRHDLRGDRRALHQGRASRCSCRT